MNHSGVRPGPNESIPLHLGFLCFTGFIVWLVPVAIVLAIPAVAWVLSRWVMMFLSWFRRRVHEATWKPWNGCYYEFEGWQIRLHPATDSIWIHAGDLFAALAMETDAVARRKLAARYGENRFCHVTEFGAEGFVDSAGLEFLATRGSPQAHQLSRWLGREILPPLRRRHGLADPSRA